MILKQGSQGPEVEHLQLKLKAAGYDCGDIDGIYGRRTAAAVRAFQADRAYLEDDGIAGPMTLGAIDAALAHKRPDQSASQDTPVPCEATTWSAFERLVSKITARPVRYGPGRGLWVRDKFVITCGPGALGLRSWPSALGRPYASFHCSSWTNFFLAWLLRRNENFTHAGNIPSLFNLLESSPERHVIPDGGVYRGYGDACALITPDGSSVARSGVQKVIDAEELLARRAELPTFIVCAQSTRRQSGWLLWHHTVLFVVDHRGGDRLYRIAADGYWSATDGWSSSPMRWIEITDENVGGLDAAVYRAYGVRSADGTYGDQARPIADVDFEEA